MLTLRLNLFQSSVLFILQFITIKDSIHFCEGLISIHVSDSGLNYFIRKKLNYGTTVELQCLHADENIHMGINNFLLQIEKVPIL